MPSIPASHSDLVAFEKPTLAHLATINKDGSPQVTPVWFDFDGTHIVFNTAEGRIKDKNLYRTPHAAVSILDPANPFRYLQVQGRVVERTTTGADAVIDRLANKYLGAEKYGFGKPGEVRVTYKMEVGRVQVMG
jgi:PPOX class probable F420-dependent enzyme